MTKQSKFYIAAVVMPGAAALVWAALHWSCPNPGAFGLYLAVTLLLGATRCRLPGLVGTYSMSFLPVLFGLNHFTPSEVLVTAALATFATCLSPQKKRPNAIQLLFNSANLTLSAGSCLLVYGFLAGRIPYLPAVLCVVVSVYFAVNTLLVSGILSLVQGKPLAEVCEAWYFWSFIYYLSGAAVMGLAMSASQDLASWVILLPIAYLMWFFWQIRSARAPLPESGASPRIPQAAQRYIYGVIAAAAALFVVGFANGQSPDPARLAFCASAAALASGCKVRLPGMVGTISLSFVVILFAASELPWGETMVIAAVAGIVQSYWKARRRPQPVQVVFNVATVILSSSAAYAVCQFVADLSGRDAALLPSLLAATALYYGSNTALVCIVLGLIERKSAASIWNTCRFWSLPYYLVGTATTGVMVVVSRTSSFYAASLTLTVMALVFFAYRAHVKHAFLSPAPQNS